MDDRAPNDRWTRFFCQIQKDLKLLLFLTTVLGIIRVVLVITFGDLIRTPVGPGDYILASLNGVRFDLRVVCYLLAPCFLATLLTVPLARTRGVERFRLIWGTFLFLIVVLLGAINLGFIREYHDQFNHWIWGLVYDDVGAILRTIRAQYPLVPMSIGMILLGIGAWFMLRLWLRNPIASSEFSSRKLDRAWKRVAVVLLTLLLLVGAFRGSFGRRPVQLKDSAITTDLFLNKLVLNPFTALRYAIKAHMRLLSSKGLEDFLPDGDIAAAVKRVFPDHPPAQDLAEYLRRTARGWPGEKPRHVFVIVMESYDSWPRLPAYRSLHLLDGLEEIAAEGIDIRSFVPAGKSTARTLAALISGVPSAGVLTNYRENSRLPYPTSVAPIFEQLGFQTRFIYGGYLSWQRIGSFATEQGFDEVLGGSHFGNWLKGNEWGVDDEVLFENLERIVRDEQPSFNLVMSTTNHPPYDIDVRAQGFPLGSIPSDLAGICDDDVSMEVLGHLWYSDQCLLRFIRKMEKRLTKPLFLITGDHWSRMFLNSRPPFYAMRSTPCVLYGKEVLRGVSVPDRMAASGNDIAPTLIEICAPKGFEYHAFGRNMLRALDAPAGFGYHSVIGPDYIIDMSSPGTVHQIPGTTAQRFPDPAPLVRHYQDLHGIAWWLLMNGRQIP